MGAQNPSLQYQDQANSQRERADSWSEEGYRQNEEWSKGDRRTTELRNRLLEMDIEDRENVTNKVGTGSRNHGRRINARTAVNPTFDARASRLSGSPTTATASTGSATQASGMQSATTPDGIGGQLKPVQSSARVASYPLNRVTPQRTVSQTLAQGRKDVDAMTRQAGRTVAVYPRYAGTGQLTTADLAAGRSPGQRQEPGAGEKFVQGYGIVKDQNAKPDPTVAQAATRAVPAPNPLAAAMAGAPDPTKASGAPSPAMPSAVSAIQPRIAPAPSAAIPTPPDRATATMQTPGMPAFRTGQAVAGASRTVGTGISQAAGAAGQAANTALNVAVTGTQRAATGAISRAVTPVAKSSAAGFKAGPAANIQPKPQPTITKQTAVPPSANQNPLFAKK